MRGNHWICASATDRRYRRYPRRRGRPGASSSQSTRMVTPESAVQSMMPSWRGPQHPSSEDVGAGWHRNSSRTRLSCGALASHARVAAVGGAQQSRPVAWPAKEVGWRRPYDGSRTGFSHGAQAAHYAWRPPASRRRVVQLEECRRDAALRGVPVQLVKKSKSGVVAARSSQLLPKVFCHWKFRPRQVPAAVAVTGA